MNSVVIPEKIVCCICSANVTFADLESHLAVLHFNSDPYQCDQCDYDYDNPPSRFPTEAAVKEHMRGKHGASDFSYRVWCNPEIDRSRENISNCMAQSVQNTLRFPETRAVSGMTVNSVNILAPPPIPVIINDILKDNSTTYQSPTTYEIPQSRKYARTSTVPSVMVNRAAPPAILNGKSTISQRPTSYQMPQSRNTVVQTPSSAHPLESARPKLITVTRTPTYQSGTTYEMPQSHIVVVRTPISPPESARSKLVAVIGSPMNEQPQLISSKASASRPPNSEIEVIKIESDDELDVKPDLRQSEFQQSGTSYEIPQSHNAVVQTPISASSPESAERKLVTVTRAGNSTTYQLDATDQISQISNAVVQTPISAPSPERAKRKFVTATGAPMNERPLLTASNASTSRPYTSLENDLGSYVPNCDVIVLDSDEEGDESCHNDHLLNDDLRLRAEKAREEKREMDKRSANTMRMRNRRQNSHLLPNSVRCDENYLVQCEECNVRVKNFVWNKKAHINRMFYMTLYIFYIVLRH